MIINLIRICWIQECGKVKMIMIELKYYIFKFKNKYIQIKH